MPCLVGAVTSEGLMVVLSAFDWFNCSAILVSSSGLTLCALNWFSIVSAKISAFLIGSSIVVLLCMSGLRWAVFGFLLEIWQFSTNCCPGW